MSSPASNTKHSDLARKRRIARRAALAVWPYWTAILVYSGIAYWLDQTPLNPATVLLFAGAAGLITLINHVYASRLKATGNLLSPRAITLLSICLHSVVTLSLIIVEGYAAIAIFIMIVGLPVVQVFFGLTFGPRPALLFTTASLIVFLSPYLLISAGPHTVTPENLTLIVLISLCLGFLMMTVNTVNYRNKRMIVGLLRKQQRHGELIEKQADELRRLSMIDGLTGLANRRHLDETLEREWSRSKRNASKRPLSLILADIDHFKLYNDALGHIGGDECLVRIAHAIKKSPQRPADVVARYGGEEFAVVLPDTDIEGACEIAARIREAVAAEELRHPACDNGRPVTLSLGVATYAPEHDRCPGDLVQRCDQALYQAKHEGRDRVIVANPPTDLAQNQ